MRIASFPSTVCWEAIFSPTGTFPHLAALHGFLGSLFYSFVLCVGFCTSPCCFCRGSSVVTWDRHVIPSAKPFPLKTTLRSVLLCCHGDVRFGFPGSWNVTGISMGLVYFNVAISIVVLPWEYSHFRVFSWVSSRGSVDLIADVFSPGVTFLPTHWILQGYCEWDGFLHFIFIIGV